MRASPFQRQPQFLSQFRDRCFIMITRAILQTKCCTNRPDIHITLIIPDRICTFALPDLPCAGHGAGQIRQKRLDTPRIHAQIALPDAADRTHINNAFGAIFRWADANHNVILETE